MNKQVTVLCLIAMGLGLFSCKKTPPNEEDVVEAYFEELKGDKESLALFFHKMPKGGDLHHHACGAVYAERYIDYALEDNLFINPRTYQLYTDPTNSTIPIQDLLEGSPNRRDSIIDHWSVRNYKENQRDGHDWFFNTFFMFMPAFVGHESEALSSLCQRAETDNISYLETMISIPAMEDGVTKLSSQIESDTSLDNELESWFKSYKELGIGQWATQNSDSLQSMLSHTNRHGVEVKFQTYAVRVIPDNKLVFGHLLLAFMTANVCPDVVGVNFLAPEDNITALKNYSLHMDMFDFLNQKYPNVKISLHAGELVQGKGDVSRGDLECHIMEALTTANAVRIGHGVDVKGEDQQQTIFNWMLENKVAAEINLESNSVILETTVDNHPIRAYWENNVPICISTDDEGVLRTNLTNQYVLLMDYLPELSYKDVKSIVYNSIKYAFLDDVLKQTLLDDLNIRFTYFENRYYNYSRFSAIPVIR